MNVSALSAYQNVYASTGPKAARNQETTIPQSVWGGSDTVSISSQAKDLAALEAGAKERAAERGTGNIKMFGDPDANPLTDTFFIPPSVQDYMPQLDTGRIQRTREVLAAADKEGRGLTAAELRYAQQGMQEEHAAIARGGQAMSEYVNAMRQLGIDPSDSESLSKFVNDSDMLKAVEDIVTKRMGKNSPA